MKCNCTLSHCRRKPDAGGFSAPCPVKRGVLFSNLSLVCFHFPILIPECLSPTAPAVLRRSNRQPTFCVVKSQPACFQFDRQGKNQQHHIFPPRILFCCTPNELLITPEGLSFGGNVYIFLSLVGFVGSRFHKRVVGKA